MAVSGSGSTGGKGTTTSAIQAGKAVVEISTIDADLKAGLARAQRMLGTFAAKMAKVGAVAIGASAGIAAPLASVFAAATERGKQLQLLSERFGDSVENISRFAYAAEQANISLEDLEGIFENFPERVSEAARGTGSATEAFRQLGLRASDLVGLPITEQMSLLADAIARVPNAMDRASIAGQLFSDTGQKLLPVFLKGSAGLRQMAEEADDLGATLSGDTARSATQISASFIRMRTAIRSAFLSIGEALFGHTDKVDEFAKVVVNAAKSVRQFIRDNKGLVVGAGLIAAALAGAGVGLLTLGVLAKSASAVLGVLGGTIGGVAKVLRILLSPVALVKAGIGAIIGVGTAVFSGLAGAIGFLFSPLGILVGLITAAGAVILRSGGFFKGWGDISSEILTDIKDLAKDTFGGITDALAAGDLGLAAEVAMAGLEVAWRIGLKALEAIWVKFRTSIATGWVKTTSSLSRGIIDFGGTVEKIFSGIAAEILKIFDPDLTDEAIDAGLAERKKQIDKDVAALQKIVTDMERDDIRDIEQKSQGALNDANARLDEAKAKLADAARRAGQAREKKDRPVAGISSGNQAASLINAINATKGAFAGLVTSGGGQSFQRTLGVSDSIPQRTLAATEAVRDNTKQIVQELRGNPGAVFE